jgi:uncharacterized protein YndB with AHSA1/START domain
MPWSNTSREREKNEDRQLEKRTGSIQVRRRMPARREVVYEAWTTPEGFRHWMCPGDITSAEAELDVRIGGSFRIVMRSPTAEHVHSGIYLAVEPPARLSFSWIAGNHRPTRVSVEFIDLGEESEIVITHEGFVIADVAGRYEGGWATIAEKLSAFLAKA